MSGGLAEAARAQGRVTKAEHAADSARAERDATICRLSSAGFSYRAIAGATSLSVSAVGKIINAGRNGQGKDATT